LIEKTKKRFHPGSLFSSQPGQACPAAGQGRNQKENVFWYPDLPNRPDQKSNSLNPGDSVNPDTRKVFAFFAKFRILF
jgi:hypothetical protein